jgi:DNA-binding NarL/FixJ family response regulator
LAFNKLLLLFLNQGKKMKEKINIIIAEDQRSYREAIAYALKGENIVTIGDAENGKELLHLLEVKKLEPDVILLDIEMPVMDGSEALIKVKELYPTMRVIILTLYDNVSLIADLKKKGANSFLSKNVTIDEIALTIRRLYYAVDFTNIPKNIKSKFTKLEIEVLRLLVAGKTSADAATIRNKTIKSIEAIRKKLYEKTGASNAAEFGVYCEKEGLIFMGRK